MAGNLQRLQKKSPGEPGPKHSQQLVSIDRRPVVNGWVVVTGNPRANRLGIAGRRWFLILNRFSILAHTFQLRLTGYAIASLRLGAIHGLVRAPEQ